MMERVDVTDVDLADVIRAVYDLSSPRGLGFLHCTPGPLSDEIVQEILNQPHSYSDYVVSLDYVSGRACKFVVREEEGRRFFTVPWYDHTDEQVAKLCERLGVSPPASVSTHGPACNCSECVAVRDRRQA